MDGATPAPSISGPGVAHLIVYTMGLPVFRTLAFTVGFLAQAVLALAIFGSFAELSEQSTRRRRCRRRCKASDAEMQAPQTPLRI